ncbi:hypothetical protein KKH23_05335 [Patescibacteria group bacterium]|nr:hypothetical protein [Patescibacteria group bacterium]
MLVVLSDPVTSPTPIDVTVVNQPEGSVVHTLEGSISVVDHWSQLAHEGKLFSASWLFPAVANNGEAVLLLDPPAPLFFHTKISVSAPGDFHMYLNEDPTVTNDGIPLNAFNMHRGIGGVSTGGIFRSPVVTGNGVQLFTSQGGSGKKEPGNTDFAEWALCYHHTYILRAMNHSGGVMEITVGLTFSEEVCE